MTMYSRTFLGVLATCGAMIHASEVAAQSHPAGAVRPWVELGFGGSRQDPNCAACLERAPIAGPSATAAVGLTITRTFGIAALARASRQSSFYTHRSNYYIALAQYSPATIAPALTLNGGFGLAQQHDDDNGSGHVIAGGAALRLTPQSTFGLTLTADWIKTVSGTLRAAPGQLTSSYRPLLFTIGLGLSLAGDNAEKPKQ